MKIPFKKQLKRIIKGSRDPQRSYRAGILASALRGGLFDPAWYKETYKLESDDLEQLFSDYFRKSCFANVNPSPGFDSETYHKLHTDVYHLGLCPLAHYLEHGQREGRMATPATNKWSPSSELKASTRLTESAKEQKVAVHLHIFYEDFIERFYHTLVQFPAEFDLLLTLSKPEYIAPARARFGKLKNVKQIEAVVVPNRGRNFGPLLVEYGSKLQEYDLFCHLHSKKSLYSGKEQTQWSDYQNEFILKDSSVTTRLLNMFSDHPELGLYYPTSFWMMPSWVNHWTCNKSFAQPFLDEWQAQLQSDFLPYPVGGMFWARPKALQQLLSRNFSYEDFPEEPLPNDGSMLHAIERLLGVLTEHNGFEQFFYYPPTGQFTQDSSYIYMNYNQSLESVSSAIHAHHAVSFDVFDTLVRREFSEPDYAKLLLGKSLAEEGVITDAQAFVRLRNETEFELRKESSFQGDISIEAIYRRIASSLNVPESKADEWMWQEFSHDLSMIQPKNEMVELFNQLSQSEKNLFIISDTYYTPHQIEKMLRKVGVHGRYQLLVSSEEQKRKDNGTMWRYMKEQVTEKEISSLIHIGDNVRADAQIPGDLGFSTFHILHPNDKWLACGFPDVISSAEKLNEVYILKWGSLISDNGRYPLIGG